MAEKRTIQQNKSLHLWFSLTAKALNNAGLDMRKTLKQDVDIPWSKDTVKEYLWRPIQKLVLNKKSTTKLLKVEDIDKVYDVVNRLFGEKFGLHIPFPSLDQLMEEEDNKLNGN